MNRRDALKALAGLALCPLCSPSGFAAEGAHWSYEGTAGPAKWGDLDAANKVCSIGSQQSPIDIGPTVKSQLPPLNRDHSLGARIGGNVPEQHWLLAPPPAGWERMRDM